MSKAFFFQAAVGDKQSMQRFKIKEDLKGVRVFVYPLAIMINTANMATVSSACRDLSFHRN